MSLENKSLLEAFFAWQIAIALFQQGRFGIFMSTSDGKITQSNEKIQKMLGFSSELLENTGWIKLTHPDDVKIDEEYLQMTVDGKISGYSLLKRYLTASGEYKPVIITPYKLNGFTKTDYYIVIIEEYNGIFENAKIINPK